jgi:hypothetical protein
VPAPPWAAVVIVSVPKPLSPLKSNGPTPPLLILVNCSVGSLLLVKTQLYATPAAMLAPGMVTAVVEDVTAGLMALASVQVMPEMA